MSEGFDPGSAPQESAAAALAACPHLVSVDGPWHAVAPSRAHRCRLLAEGRPTLDRQRAHCLVPAHVACPVWLEVHGAAGPAARPGPFVATAPVVLEGPGLSLTTQRTARRLAAPTTAVVATVALGLLFLSRGPLAPGTSGTGGDGPSGSPIASPLVATPQPTPAPSAVLTAPPTAQPSPATTPRPTATPPPKTYKVQAGDTLSAIAERFGTTVDALAELNNIENRSLIRVGQVLQLP